MIKSIQIGLLLLFASVSFAQEIVGNLPWDAYNPAKLPKVHFKIVQLDSMVYTIDTLSLPFIDDFARNSLKYYTSGIGDVNVRDSVWLRISVDNVFPTEYSYRVDTTFDVVEIATDSFSLVAKNSVVVDIYNDLQDLNTPTLTDTVWPVDFDTILLSGDTIHALLTPHFSYVNTDTVYFVLTDDNSRWLDSYVYINNHMAVNPPSIGVATFDGLNEDGYPYDFDIQDNYGIADYLTSKPINLSAASSDSTFLSFYYQPQGLCNDPSEEDSLVVEFYNSSTASWHYIWSAEGTTVHAFKPVFIQIPDTFLQKAFQFRFFNYATLNGNIDQWHIDYVYLDDHRFDGDTILDDVMYHYEAGSLIEGYEAMPYKHYRAYSTIAQQNTMMDSIPFILNCIDDVADCQGYLANYKIYNSQDTLIGYFNNTTNRAEYRTFNVSTIYFPVYDLDSANGSPWNDFYFPMYDSLNKETFKIDFDMGYTSGAEVNDENNHLIQYQVFHNYYAYDDGTGELGYGVYGNGSMLAYEFNLNPLLPADTLTGIKVYFNPFRDIFEEEFFHLKVWSSLSPEVLLYEGTIPYSPEYASEPFEFKLYGFDKTIMVNNKFYVGWESLTDNYLYVGLDRNNDVSDKIYYHVGAGWKKSSFDGALMIRPVFGAFDEVAVGLESIGKKEGQQQFSIHPNPAQHIVYINSIDNEASFAMHLLDIYGKQIMSNKFIGTGNIDVSDLAKGIYLINILSSEGNKETHRLIVR